MEGDHAPNALFSSVSEGALKRETYATFFALLDNYTFETGQAEHFGRAEQQEIDRFLSACSRTAVFQVGARRRHQLRASARPPPALPTQAWHGMGSFFGPRSELEASGCTGD